MKYIQNWQARAVRPNGVSDWFDAEVPGNVQYDYGRFMGWGDINYADNVLKYGDTENYTWEYRTVLSYACKDGESAFFVSEGIDYKFDLLIDGKMQLSHEGMFSHIETELPSEVGHELIIRIHPHPKNTAVQTKDREQANQSVKPPVCYGWDWHPRMLVSGIWQDTYVEVRDHGYIHRCEPYYKLDRDRTHARIWFETECDLPVEITLFDPDGRKIGTGDHFDIYNPQLWWCNGQGDQKLYTYTANSGTYAVSGSIGLRSIRLIMNQGAWYEPSSFPMSRSPAPIQLELNGRPVFAKGSNWVNPDIFNGRVTAARYEELILLAREANMNLFRCWGGSGINKKAFYDLCDRMGIMLWVEFPLACNNYEGNAEYLEILEQEATAIIRSLRSHPSVVMYCGGNELFNFWSGMTDQSSALRLLNKLCYELDREKPFLMTSPLIGMGHGSYVFFDSISEIDVFGLFQNAHRTAYTEFGCSAIAETDELRQILPAEELFPISKEGNWRLHNAFGAWGEERWLCMDVLEKYTVVPLNSIEKIVALSNWLQCEGYKAIYEEARRQAPYCSMALNWDYCEPWINAAGNNLIAYPARPKMAYYAVKSSLRPVLASARISRFDWKAGECFHAELWLLNDAPEQTEATIHVSVRLGEAEYHLLTWETGCVPAGKNKIGPTINWILPDTTTDEIRLILDGGKNISNEYRLRYWQS